MVWQLSKSPLHHSLNVRFPSFSFVLKNHGTITVQIVWFLRKLKKSLYKLHIILILQTSSDAFWTARLVNSLFSNVRAWGAGHVSAVYLAEPAGVVSCDSAGAGIKLPGRMLAEWASFFQMAVSWLQAAQPSPPPPYPPSHPGRTRNGALWSPIMIPSKCAALQWLLTAAAVQIAWMMENQWDLILVCQYEY